MAFERNHLQTILSRIKEKRRFIQVLAGPRQVGKTTLANQLLKKINTPGYFVTADGGGHINASWIETHWESARQQCRQGGKKDFIFIIDEIQKVENWSEIIKKCWDEDTRSRIPVKLILLGSSRLLLQKGLTESLAGRFEMMYVSHWSFTEMKKAFGWNVDQYIWFGGYPGSASLIKDEIRWKHYVINSLIEASISKDILMLTRVDKPALMKRLFELGCLYSGQIVSLTKVLGQLQDKGNTVTLSHYLHLLDTAGLLAGIDKYYTEKIHQRSSSPKFQVHNSALISAQNDDKFAEVRSTPEKWGRMVESAVGAHLLNHSMDGSFKLYYWRHRDFEVDFVLKKGTKIIGLEIKSGPNVSMSGMNEFRKIFKPDKILLIGATGFPVKDFFSIHPEELF